jgi:FtsP/CotA-like multicopper oxidase with cupredoxin domain
MHLGYLGPLIRAAVGDTIRVFFKNNAPSTSYSMHPHGVFYTKANEGVPQDPRLMQSNMSAAMNGSSNMTTLDGSSVPPGGNYTYIWEVPERAGPGPNDPSSIVWMYHSHVDETRDTNTGLVGAMVISRANAADRDTARPTDVDKEFVLLWTIVNENLSGGYLSENARAFIQPSLNDSAWQALRSDGEFQLSNLKHAVNGRLYSNLPGLNMTVGQRVRWYLIALGDEQDIHGVHWHGQTLLYDGHRVDTMELLPASMKTIDMVPDSPGTWLVHCHTNHHMVVCGASVFCSLTQFPDRRLA